MTQLSKLIFINENRITQRMPCVVSMLTSLFSMFHQEDSAIARKWLDELAATGEHGTRARALITQLVAHNRALHKDVGMLQALLPVTVSVPPLSSMSLSSDTIAITDEPSDGDWVASAASTSSSSAASSLVSTAHCYIPVHMCWCVCGVCFNAAPL